MDIKQQLLALCARTGVSGLEGEAAAYAADLLRQYGEVVTTPLGSLLCSVRPAGRGEPLLLLDAHIDEIGMIVTYIEDKGFLRVAACGGIDRRLLMASLVSVHTASGPLAGIVCSVPPHLSSDEDKKNKKVEEIYIDIGFPADRAKELVQPGDRVTINAQDRELMNGLVSGRAIDDRAGCMALLCAAETLAGAQLRCGVTVLFSSMEEVGGQGARTAAYTAAPTHAIAVDVSFAHTPDAPRERCGELYAGPMIGFAPVLSRQMSDRLVALARENAIPFQLEVMGGKTGTNADAIVTARGGVVTGLVSIPQKYMHTPIETVAVEDVENTGKLLAAYAGYLGGNAR